MQIKQAICKAIIYKSDRYIGAKNYLDRILNCSMPLSNVNILRAKGNMLCAKAEVL